MSNTNRPLNMSKKPASKDWHRADIIAAVRKAGSNLQQLSIKYELGAGTLRNALYVPAPKYERLIASFLGMKPEDIWPSRYNQDGTPKSGRGERGLGRYKPKNRIEHTNDTSIQKSRNVYQIDSASGVENGAVTV